MRFNPWRRPNSVGFTVYTSEGIEVGDIWDDVNGIFRFFHAAEAYDPAPISAEDLREVVAKLDELNGV